MSEVSQQIQKIVDPYDLDVTQHVKIGLISVPPFVMPCAKLLAQNSGHKKLCSSPGIVPELLLLVQGFFTNVTYSWSWENDGNFGSRLSNGTWDGLVGQLAREEIDLSYMALLYSRREAIDYTFSIFHQSQFEYLVHKASTAYPFPVAGTFDWRVWILAIIGQLTISILIFLLIRKNWTCFDSVFHVSFSQKSQVLWKSNTSQVSILICTWSLFALFCLTIFRYRFLHLLLSYDGIPFRNNKELALSLIDGKYKLVTASLKSNEFTNLEISTFNDDRKFLDAVAEIAPIVTGSVESAVDYVARYPRTVTIQPRETVSTAVYRHTHLTYIPNRNGAYVYRGFAAPKNSTFVNRMDPILSILVMFGIVERLTEKYSPIKSLVIMKDFQPMRYYMINSAVQLLLSAYAVAILIFLVELLWHRKKHHKNWYLCDKEENRFCDNK